MIFYIATDEQGSRHIKGTQADARVIDKDAVQIDVPVDKAGLQKALQELFNQIDTLTVELADSRDDANQLANFRKPVAASAPSYAQQSIAIEDAWDKLPLTQQLHFAAKAMEAARDHVGKSS